jgi:hypothetical protein
MKIALPLKIILGVCVLALLTFVILSQKGTLTPATGSSNTATDTTTKVTPSVSMEDAQKQLQAIQAQVTAGTLSPEEANKQINALGAQVAPPPLPADAKKTLAK